MRKGLSLLLCLWMLLLTACGGGGSGEGTSSQQGTPPQVPQITTQAQGVTVAVGNATSFAVVATGTAPLTYQWYRDGTALADGSGTSGATTATLSLSNVAADANGARFTVVVRNAAGQVISPEATLTVTLPAGPVITQQVTGASVEAGQTARFSVTATVATGTTATYRWYRDGAALSDGGGFSGTDSPALSVATSDTSLNGSSYRVVVTDGYGQRAASADATLSVRAPIPALAVDTLSGPGTVAWGQSASFSASASGGVAPLSIQWVRDGTPIPGATGGSYVLPAVTMADQGALFWVVVTDARGETVAPTTAQRVALQVTPPAAPTIVSQSQSVTVAAGAAASFSVTTSGTGVTVQWYRDGVAVSGATADSYSFTAASGDNGARFHAVITDVAGQTAASTAVTLTVATQLSGVAAQGAPLSRATITLTDAAGHTLSTTADDSGNYSFDVTGLTPPFQLVARKDLGDNDAVHYAVITSVSAAQGNTANITPLTTAVSALSSDLSAPRPLTSAELAALNTNKVADATRDVVTAISGVAAAVNVNAAAFDPLRTAFNPDREGVDALLDQLAVTVRPDGVAIANKMAPPAPGATSTLTTATGLAGSVQLSKTGLGSATAQIRDTTVLLTGPFERVRQALQDCFALDHTQRLVSGVLHPTCQNVALATYLHNGDRFVERWRNFLTSATFNGARFESPVTRLRLTEARVAVNFNFSTADGSVAYTMPEILEQVPASGGTPASWWLGGNLRRWMGYVETSMVIDEDRTAAPYTNVNLSKIESSFRVMFDPRYTWDGSTMTKPGSSDTYDTVKAANLTAGRRTVGCAVVYGPGEMVAVTSGGVTSNKIAGFSPNGVLMRVPSGSSTGDYLAFDTNLGRLSGTAVTGTRPNRHLTLMSGGASVCNGKTSSASSNYTVELTVTGNGRARSYYTSPRYAEVDPTPALAQVFDNNPSFDIVVFDTNGDEIDAFTTRFLGGLAPASLGAALVADNRLPTFTADTIARYLDGIGSDTVTGVLPDVAWTAPDGAYRPDRTNAYAELYWGNTTTTPGLFTYRRFGNRSGSTMVSTGGVSYVRGTTSLGQSPMPTQMYGTAMFTQDTGSMSGIDNGYVMRQLGLRFYTEDNLRLYRQVTNRVMQR